MTVTIKHEASLVQTRLAPREGAANLGARLAACLAASPLAPAIRMGGEGISEGGSDEQWLSYGALNARVGEIAARLQGLAVGERVGLYLSRSPDLVASLLACLRLGLCFVPLEPDFPLERLQGIARQARLSAVICDDEVGTPDFGCPLRSLKGPAPGGTLSWPRVDDALAAYMMFTSGSTGEPKGWSSAGGPCSASSTGSASGSDYHPTAIGSLSPPRPSTSRCWRCWARSGVVAG